MDLKQEFLGYLRTVYGGQPMPMSQSSLPPLDSPAIYPAFRSLDMNQGLSMLGGLQQPMSPSGFGPQSGMQPARQLGGGSPGLMQAQDVLLGR